MQKNKIIFYVATGLLTIILLTSISMYFFNHQMVAGVFKSLGYPVYIIYPYGFVKLLGLVALWFFRGKLINEWAYSGFLFAFILAFFAHIMVNDGEQWGALVAMLLLITSYIFSKKIND